MMTTSIAVCIACHNRKIKTLTCLERLYAAHLPQGATLTVYLLDDASTDGTGAAVREKFPHVQILQGNGDCFWAGGMRIAYGAALREAHDYYVWLNDDVELFPDAFERVFSTLNEVRRVYGGEHIVVGAMQARHAPTTQFSGFKKRARFQPWIFDCLDPYPDRPRECETLNGNFVLIPAGVAKVLGNIHSAYRHGLADLALGLAARNAGFRNWIAQGYVGICNNDTTRAKSWLVPNISFTERIHRMERPYGHPARTNLAYSRLFGTWAPVVFVVPYLSIIKVHFFSGLRERITRKGPKLPHPSP